MFESERDELRGHPGFGHPMTESERGRDDHHDRRGAPDAVGDHAQRLARPEPAIEDEADDLATTAAIAADSVTVISPP